MNFSRAQTLKALVAERASHPFSDLRFGPVDIEVRQRDDGTILVENRVPLPPPEVTQIGEYLHRHAQAAPDRVFLAERDGPDSWRRVTYREAAAQVDAISAWLLRQERTQGRPVVILSENSIQHALLQLAAMQVGIPSLSVSPAYSLMSKDHGKLRAIIEKFQPGVVYASDPGRFGAALAAIRPLCDFALVADGAHDGAVAFDRLCAEAPTTQVRAAFERVTLDSVGRYLLTSGSTGSPKGVLVTQRNMIASGMLWDQCWPFLKNRPPVLVDWLPWNHTAGANGSFNIVLRHGGTMYIDNGKPVNGLVEHSVRNLAEIRPTLIVNVPRGLDMLLPALEEDAEVAGAIFANLDAIVYGGAALPLESWARLEAVSILARGVRIPILSSLGSTETTTPATLGWWPATHLGSLGLPCPGVSAKLVPHGDKLEIRFRGDNISPGYFEEPEATAAMFDDEGYFKIGDAVRFIDPERPELGFTYDGRISENFKLLTGTWVAVGNVRGNVVAAGAPLIQDVVVTGHNRDELGLLVFPDLHRIRQRMPALAGKSAGEIVAADEVRASVKEALCRYNADHPGSSERIRRAMLMALPPDVDAGEITDKGYINQRGVVRTREQDIARLYDAATDRDNIIVID